MKALCAETQQPERLSAASSGPEARCRPSGRLQPEAWLPQRPAVIQRGEGPPCRPHPGLWEKEKGTKRGPSRRYSPEARGETDGRPLPLQRNNGGLAAFPHDNRTAPAALIDSRARQPAAGAAPDRGAGRGERASAPRPAPSRPSRARLRCKPAGLIVWKQARVAAGAVLVRWLAKRPTNGCGLFAEGRAFSGDGGECARARRAGRGAISQRDVAVARQRALALPERCPHDVAARRGDVPWSWPRHDASWQQSISISHRRVYFEGLLSPRSSHSCQELTPCPLTVRCRQCGDDTRCLPCQALSPEALQGHSQKVAAVGGPCRRSLLATRPGSNLLNKNKFLWAHKLLMQNSLQQTSKIN